MIRGIIGTLVLQRIVRGYATRWTRCPQRFRLNYECYLCRRVYEYIPSEVKNKRSCMCQKGLLIHNAKTTHGCSRWVNGANKSLYSTWLNMRKRCLSKKNLAYQYYGERGIDICPQWDDFQVFERDVGQRPTPKHTLDRVNNDRGYWPDNVRWATRKQQCENRRPYASVINERNCQTRK